MKTVKELIELLEKENPDRIVVMSIDGKGNQFSPLSDHTLGLYEPDHTSMTRRILPVGEINEDDGGPGTPAIVLWPSN